MDDRKRAEILANEQNALIERIAAGRPLRDCLVALTESVPRLEPGVRAAVLLADEAREAFAHVLAHDIESSFGCAIEDAAVCEQAIGTCGITVHSNQPVTCADVTNEDRWAPEWRELCRSHGVCACHSQPIMGDDGKAVASFLLVFDRPGEPSGWHRRIAEFGAHVAGIVLARDRTTRALRDSEERFRGIFSQAAAGIAQTDLSGRFLAVNDTYCRLVGRTREELLALRMQDVTHRDDLARNILRFEQLAAGGDDFAIEKRYVRPDGREVWANVSVTALRDPAGAPRSMVAVVIDVSDRHRARQRLIESEERLQAALAESERLRETLDAELNGMRRLHELSVRLTRPTEGLEAVMRDMLEAARELVAADKCTAQIRDVQADVLNLVSGIGFPDDFYARFHTVTAEDFTTCAAALRQGERVIMENLAQDPVYENFARLAAEYDVRAAMSVPLPAADGSLMGVFTTYWTRPHRPSERELRLLDLYVQQAARHIERKRAELLLTRSQRTFSDLVERCPFGIYLVDSQFRILQMNAGSRSGAFGNVRPIVGRAFDEAMRILWPEPVAAEIIARFRHTLATGEAYFSNDFLRQRADKDQVEGYEWELHRLTLPDEKHAVVCYYYDSTRLWQAEQALRDADRRKDEFLATLAHELRNPLAPLRQGVHLLRLMQAGPAEETRIHEMMERQVGHMVRLVDDLMEVSRITRGKIDLRLERLNVADIVRGAVETSGPLLAAARHCLTVAVPDEPLCVEGDAVRLMQVLTNLLNNAAKYTPEGGDIRLLARREGQEVLISVRDNGLGIPGEMLPKVFEMFAQIDRDMNRAQGGAGHRPDAGQIADANAWRRRRRHQRG